MLCPCASGMLTLALHLLRHQSGSEVDMAATSIVLKAPRRTVGKSEQLQNGPTVSVGQQLLVLDSAEEEKTIAHLIARKESIRAQLDLISDDAVAKRALALKEMGALFEQTAILRKNVFASELNKYAVGYTNDLVR